MWSILMGCLVGTLLVFTVRALIPGPGTYETTPALTPAHKEICAPARNYGLCLQRLGYETRWVER
jgi:hypothetical protein